MNFIAKNIHLVGLVLLAAFGATAAGLYFNVPARLSNSRTLAPAMKYSCPMHPEVVASKAGDCPRCGMALTTATPAPDGRPMMCPHSAAAGESAGIAAANQAGCGHDEAGGAGGCCAKKLPATASPIPGGCTRNLQPPTANHSE